MDQKLKERLLGAVIILSVLIFFLPMLFKQNSANFDDSISQTQEQMIADRVALEQLKELELEKEYIIQEERVSVVEKPKVVRAAPVVLKDSHKDIHKNTQMWVLRMGVFSNPNNAKLLEQNLSAKGYPSYSQIDSSKGAKITRVFVGPKKSESEIKKMRDQIKHDLKMQGIVMQNPERGATT